MMWWTKQILSYVLFPYWILITIMNENLYTHVKNKKSWMEILIYFYKKSTKSTKRKWIKVHDTFSKKHPVHTCKKVFVSKVLRNQIFFSYKKMPWECVKSFDCILIQLLSTFPYPMENIIYCCYLREN